MRVTAQRNDYELVELDSIASLRACAEAWDDLWWRCPGAYPTARAETIAQCVEAFHAGEPFRALVVARHGRLLAALPLVDGRLKRVLRVAGLPGSFWSPGGTLLIDQDCDADAVLTTLVTGIARMRTGLVLLEAVMPTMARWHHLKTALQHVGLDYYLRERYQVAAGTLEHDWERYTHGLSRNHRRAMRRAERAADALGEVRFTLHLPTSQQEVETLVMQGFAIEDASWKGRAGSSVLQHPDALAFFLRQAGQLAAWGQCAIVLLAINNEPIAFEYAFASRGIYAPLKVAYDPRFARLAPGQLLRWHLFRQLEADPQWRGFDFIGPVNKATASWATETYPLCRLVIAPSHWSSRSLLWAWRHWQPNSNTATDALPCPASEPHEQTLTRC